MNASAFRLRTFSPRAEPEAKPQPQAAPEPQLPFITESDVEAARDEAWRLGFLQAQDELTAAFLEDRTRLTSDFIEALSDARLSNEAARRHVLASLSPTVAALCEAIAPALAQAGFAAEIVARVDRALAAAPDARPRLRCAPEVALAVEAILIERGFDATVESAPELLPREAELHWEEGFDHIDMDACVAEIRACFASHLAPARAGDDTGGDGNG